MDAGKFGVCLVCAAHTQETEVKVSSTLRLTECERFLHAHNPHAHTIQMKHEEFVPASPHSPRS